MDTWRDKIEWYKAWYQQEYSRQPSEKLITEFCQLRGIPWPLPREETLEPPDEVFWRTMDENGSELDG